MKAQFIKVLAVVSLVFSVSSIYAQTAYVKELDRLEVIEGQMELFRKLLAFEPFHRAPEPKAIQEIQETLDWLKRRGFQEAGSVRYTYNLAMWLWHSGNKDTAMAMYLFGTIKARSDAARCLDKTSAPSRIRDYENYLASAAQTYLPMKSKAEKDFIFQITTQQLEQVLSRQKPDDWLCSGGMAHFFKYSQKHGNLDGKEVPTSIGQLGKTINIEDFSLKPDFVADDIWTQERAKAINAATQSVSKFLFETIPASK